MHQKRTRPETMPAYTHKHGEPKTNTRTDKRPVRTQHWLFKPPEFSCLPVPDSPYRMASTVHQTRGRERNFPSRRTGCLPARSLASALRRLECPVRSPLYRKLSSAPDTFLLPSGASDLHWTLLPERQCLYLSFPSVLGVFSSPGQGILDEPPNVLPDVRIPGREERRLPRQCNSQNREVYY